MAYQYLTADYGVTTAVIDCITRDGVHNVSVDTIARELKRSRSVLFQRFRSLRGLLAAVHEDMLVRFNSHVDHWQENREEVFDRWWKALSHDLRTPFGTGFRALRGLVADEGGCELLAVTEIRGMPALVKWIEGAKPNEPAPLVAYRLWVYMLAAAPFPLGSPPEEGFRRQAKAELQRIWRSNDPPRTAVQPSAGAPSGADNDSCPEVIAVASRPDNDSCPPKEDSPLKAPQQSESVGSPPQPQ